MVTSKQTSNKKNELKDLLQSKLGKRLTDYKMYEELLKHFKDLEESQDNLDETDEELEELEMNNLKALSMVEPPECFVGVVNSLPEVSDYIVNVLLPGKHYVSLKEKVQLLNAYAQDNELTSTEELIINETNKCEEHASISSHLKGILCFDDKSFLVWQDVYTDFFKPYDIGFVAGDFVGKEIFNSMKKLFYKQIHPDHNSSLTREKYLEYNQGTQSISQYLH